MADAVSIALVGIGGYGETYLRQLFEPPAGAPATRLVAAVDPVAPPEGWGRRELMARGIPLYADIDAMFAARAPELVVISSPIPFHADQVCEVLKRGVPVLCEKPLCATIQDARRMREAERRAGRFAAIGYQWSFSRAIQDLKRDVMSGALGRPIRCRVMVLWRRTGVYYRRNNWAARLQTADGRWVLDSPVHNATAHYLHNIFYVLGATRETSDPPVEVTGELHRARPIESFDTGALRCRTHGGVEVLFYATHSVAEHLDPAATFEFENAVVRCAERTFSATFNDGTVRSYGAPDADGARKLWDCVECARTGAPVACGVAAATAEVLCVNGLHESVPAIADIPPDLIEVTGEPGDQRVVVRGLAEALTACYGKGVLPSELGGLPWARPGRTVNLRGYEFFPSPGWPTAK